MYALVGLPLGHLSDKWHRTALIAIGTTVWSLLTAATGMAQNYAQLFIARLGVGLGEATCAPAGQSLIGDFFRRIRRAFAMGVFMLGPACRAVSCLLRLRNHLCALRMARCFLHCLRSRTGVRSPGSDHSRTAARRARSRPRGDQAKRIGGRALLRGSQPADHVVDHPFGHFPQLQYVCHWVPSTPRSCSVFME